MARKIAQNGISPYYAAGAVLLAFVLGMTLEAGTGKTRKTAKRAVAGARKRVRRARKAIKKPTRRPKQRTALEDQKAAIEKRLQALKRNHQHR
jgi:hypothetical protein